MPRKKPPNHLFYGLTPESTPAWRWKRANQIIQLGKNRSRDRDGPDIYRAIGFIRKTLRDFTGHGMKQLLREDPSLVMAVKLTTESRRRELEIQCRVLAGESAGAIAVEVGSTKAVIETYCKLFFDVPGRRHAISYIRHRVAGVPLNGRAPVESLAKLSCYNHGPAMVPAWMDYLDHVGQFHDLTTDIGRQREAIELYVEAMNLALTPDNAGSFVKRAAFIHRMDAKVFRERRASEMISLNADQMISDSVIWSTEPAGFERGHPKRHRSGAAKQTAKAKSFKIEQELVAV